MADLPEPGPGLRPVLEVWPAGRPIVRAHPSAFGATEFDRRRDKPGRFSPIVVGRAVVGVLYGAEDAEAAASETIFHTLPVAEVRPRLVALVPYASWMWSTIAPRRDLGLISLRAQGLRRLRVSREQLIMSGRTAWPVTRRWAAALRAAAPKADGLWWTSRQAPRRSALMLFAARETGGVRRADLEVIEAPVPFLSRTGAERLAEVATNLDVTLVMP